MSEYRFNAIGYVRRGGGNPSTLGLQTALTAQLAAQGLVINYVELTESNASVLYYSFFIGGSVSGGISQSNFYSRVRIALNRTFNQSFDNFNGAVFTSQTTNTKPTTTKPVVTTKDVQDVIQQNQQTTGQNLPVADTEESFTDMLKKYGISTSVMVLAGVALLVIATKKK